MGANTEMRWENSRIEMNCGCSLKNRIRIWLKPKIKFPPLKEYEIDNYKGAKKVTGKFEKYLIESCQEWGEHIRDPLPIASTGDTIVVGGEKEIMVATIRKIYRRKLNEKE